MCMVIPAVEARDTILKRLNALFEPNEFKKIAPGIHAPAVMLGYPVNEPPFYVSVDEVPDTADTTGSASMGHAEISFSVNIWLYAQHSKLDVAANTLIAYTDAVFASILADQSLNRSVDNSFPSISETGTAAVSSKRYIAASVVKVDCKVSSACPAEVMEVVNETNRNM